MTAPRSNVARKVKKYPYKQVRPIAEQIVRSLEPFCEKIEVAGSLRREVATIGDIEIVAIPKLISQPFLISGGSNQVSNELHTHLDSLVGQGKITKHLDASGRQSWGPKLRKFVVTTTNEYQFKVDLFMCEAENWGNTMLIRTGSKEFGRWIVTKKDGRYSDQHNGAMPENMKHHKGRLWIRVDDDDDGYEWQALDIKSEWDFFDAIKLPHIPPIEREADNWFIWLLELDDFLEKQGGRMYWTDKI